MSPEVKRIVREMRRKGWAVEHRNSGHIRLTHPSGAFITTSLTPSDGNAPKAIRRDIARLEANSCPSS